MIHAADLSAQARKFEISTQWADNLFEEFFNQGDVEKAQNLEVSFLCDRDTTSIASNQGGFISFFVMPVFTQLSELAPHIRNVQLAHAKTNIKKWELKAIQEQNADSDTFTSDEWRWFLHTEFWFHSQNTHIY